jgi:tRNA (guanine-N7-)-methyltransferase
MGEKKNNRLLALSVVEKGIIPTTKCQKYTPSLLLAPLSKRRMRTWPLVGCLRRYKNPAVRLMYSHLSSKTGNKIRQHVNPLSQAKMQPMALPTTWVNDSFDSNGKEVKVDHFIIDVGCGKGQWALDMASSCGNVNVVGIEIRKPAFDIAIERSQDSTGRPMLSNLLYLNGNVNVDIRRILTDCLSFGAKKIDIAIQFPDPHFKTRNHKRRVVNESFVEALGELLPVHSSVFVQSDVEEVALDFAAKFANSRFRFDVTSGHSLERLHFNASPYHPIVTERERNCIKESLQVYRIHFLKR